MKLHRISWLVPLVVVSIWAQPAGQIEPNAGTWKTWAISSGKDYRVPPPPDAAATARELQWLHNFVAESDPSIAPEIKFWDAGSPAYRWIDLISTRFLQGRPVTAYPHRVYAYVAMAMYDATVATWDSKYAYNRPRPSVADPTLQTALPTPQSPSYPSEHAATAAAAAGVLSYFFPDEATTFEHMAEEAARSRLYAGLQYPSDYSAGLDLGRQVAARVIAIAQADGSDAVWAGTVPTGKCMWLGTNPGNVTAANKWMAEDKLDQNPPRAARVYALVALSFFDSFIASQDGKFTYWYIRPNQLDPAIIPLFPVPHFPSYPSNHSTFSATRSEMLAYLFPLHADSIRAVGKEAGNSRIWAGIHYQIDNAAGGQLGRSVAQKFITWANSDGSQ